MLQLKRALDANVRYQTNFFCPSPRPALIFDLIQYLGIVCIRNAYRNWQDDFTAVDGFELDSCQSNP
jgi:hypothetical protein